MNKQIDREDIWAIIWLLLIGVVAYFTIFMVIFSFLKQTFWS